MSGILFSMIRTNNGIEKLFRLISFILFVRWSFILLSMDAYLFSDPTRYLFWGAGIKRVFLAAFLSSGLFISTFCIGRRHQSISIILIVISMGGSILILPEKSYWILWFISIFIHGYAIFNLYKSRLFKQSLKSS